VIRRFEEQRLNRKRIIQTRSLLLRRVCKKITLLTYRLIILLFMDQSEVLVQMFELLFVDTKLSRVFTKPMAKNQQHTFPLKTRMESSMSLGKDLNLKPTNSLFTFQTSPTTAKELNERKVKKGFTKRYQPCHMINSQCTLRSFPMVSLFFANKI